MQIVKILKKLNKKYYKHRFSSICINSKSCNKGDIFFAIKGYKNDGNKYIHEAISRGARTIISKKIKSDYKNNILYLNNRDPRLLFAFFASKIYKNKPKNLVAVTGTNGKSSVAEFYRQILELNKISCASIGTLGIKFRNSKINTINTTVDSNFLNKILKKLKKNGIENVILEASSHGLDQKRLDFIQFNTGIFTNFSRDHLDYHKSYKNYLNSKLKLFKNLLKKGGTIVFDNDIKIANTLRSVAKNKNYKSIYLGKAGGLNITNHKYLDDSQQIDFKYKNKNYYFQTRLIGNIQIKNLLIAALAASKILPMYKIVNSLNKVKSLNGRFQQISKLKNGSRIILDYSHTPEALKTCILNIRDQFKYSKISVLFGCGGDRDKPKRVMMGKIASDLSDKVYLTDDNPRNESPKNIRIQIKKKINKNKLIEIPSRKKAIEKSINDLNSGEILIIAGKGHETYQEYKKKKFFSDKKFIKQFTKIKDDGLSKCLNTNIFNEIIGKDILSKYKKIEGASINSKKIKKNNIFIGLKGEKFNGSQFANEAIKNKAVLAIISNKKIANISKMVSVRNTLDFFNHYSSKIRQVKNIKAISITGSSGKTSLKELLGQSLSKLVSTTYSKKSYNNKFGIPLSLSQIKTKNKFGVFELGMDRKGEITNLSKIIKPDVGLITNISYAHIKNFKNLNGIAAAKAELIDQISSNGTLVLNQDDKFYNFFKKKANKRKLNVISFSVNKKSKANISMKKIKKKNKDFEIYIRIFNETKKFLITSKLKPYIGNILGTLSVLSIFFNLTKIHYKIFFDFRIPDGRGDIKKIKVGKKILFLIDESYNSNPDSLNFSIKKFDNINIKNKRKKIILGDMLELGKYSKILHVKASETLNKSNLSNINVYGKFIRHTYNKIKTQKKGKVFDNLNDIKEFIKKKLVNGDHLMIKGSNATGLNSLVKELR